MQSAFLIVVCLSITFTRAVGNGSINYCGSRMCGNTDAHTFCRYSEGPSHDCMGYITAGLSNDEISRVIARLNRRRNEAASGRLRRLHSAGNMLKLRWVDELAREAQRWADQCRPPSVPEEHDACRDLYSISIGQCVASVVGEAPGLRVESMVDIWYMQNMLYKGNTTIYIPPNRNSSFYGDFAQIMWSESYMVGCGRSKFMSPWQGRLRSVERLVCNIAPRGPPPLRPLWSPSAPTALCPSRSKPDNHFHALCDIQLDSTNINEVDATMTLEEHLLLYTVLDLERNKSINYPGSLDEIYLTRLALATMENDYPMDTYYSSIQRRDITNTNTLENGQNKRYSSTRPALTYEINIPPSSFRTTVKIKERKRIALIGRPKPYNMDELTDLDNKPENNLQSEDFTKRDEKFYTEYDFVEPFEDNDITDYKNIVESINHVNSDNVISETDIAKFNNEFIRDFIKRNNNNKSALNKRGISEISPSTENRNLMYTNSEINNDGEKFDGIMTNRSLIWRENMKEYLPNSETIQELQDALERMEVDLSTSSIIDKQGKVRRELREAGEDRLNEKIEMGKDILNDETEKNSSIDKSLMYNMVLKYMPYLRQYHGGLLSTGANKAVNISSSILKFLLICICNVRLLM